ncbi:hypothetical protein D3C76_1790560 [compost metagenome]
MLLIYLYLLYDHFSVLISFNNRGNLLQSLPFLNFRESLIISNYGESNAIKVVKGVGIHDFQVYSNPLPNEFAN